jgi:fermentation-respiration switch protein FrsA (DUF1100 family)
LKRILAIAALVLVALYVSACGVLVAFQNQLIYHPSDEIVPPMRDDTSEVIVVTADGESLRAWWRPPDPDQSPSAPVFLYLGGNAERPEHSEGRIRRVAEHGAGYLVVAYRGYGGSTGRPSEAGLHADARAAYDWLLDQGVAPTDLVIHGFSLGSGVASRLAADRQARALILEAPFTALDDLIVDRAPVVLPWRPFIRDSYRTRDWIGDVDEPILILHGDADTVIPFAHGQELARLAGAQFEPMPGSDHATLTVDGAYEHIWAFLGEAGAPSP